MNENMNIKKKFHYFHDFEKYTPDDTPSIEALKLELQLIVSNQEVFKSKNKPVPPELTSRQTTIVTKMKYYRTSLAIPAFKKSYGAGLHAQIVKENEIAAAHMQSSRVQQAEHYIKRKKLMTLEYQSPNSLESIEQDINCILYYIPLLW